MDEAEELEIKIQIKHKRSFPSGLVEELRSVAERYNAKITIDTCLSMPALLASCSYEPAAKKKKEQPQSSVEDPPSAPPPSDRDNIMCPYCRQTPCVITTPPNWLRGSAYPCLSNLGKRCRVYKKFWTLLGRLGLRNDPHYLALKATQTSVNDKRILPLCVITEVRRRFPNPAGVLYTDFQPL